MGKLPKEDDAPVHIGNRPYDVVDQVQIPDNGPLFVFVRERKTSGGPNWWAIQARLRRIAQRYMGGNQ